MSTTITPVTAGDVYALVTFGALVLSVAASVGFSIDRWPEWKARNEAHRINARWDHEAWRAQAAALPATVSRPADPSPQPRRTTA